MKSIKKVILFVGLLLLNMSRIYADTFDMTPFIFNDNTFGSSGDTCAKIAGPNILKVIHGSITTIRIVGVILAIANAMMILLPAVMAKDADAVKKATHKCIIIGVVLAIIGIFPSIVSIIARIFDFDLSCLA